jgi:hypothetical protein
MPELTEAMRRLLEHVAANPGRLRDYASRRDFPVSIARRDTIFRAQRAGFIDGPVSTATRTYELTPAGRAALLGRGE